MADQIYDKIVLRNDTEANWSSADPVLLRGEIGITIDTTPKKFKIGDGTSLWSVLPYNISSINISDIPGLQDALDAKENEFTKNTAFNKNFGTTIGTTCEGNDSRLSDSRNPLFHEHAIQDVTDLQTVLDGKEPTKGTDNNYVTDAQLVVIGNTSGVNTGDQDLSGLQPKKLDTELYVSVSEKTNWNAKAETSDIPIALSELSDDTTHRLVTDAEKSTWNGKQDLLVNQTNIKSLNNQSLLGSGNLTISGGGSLTIENNGVDLTERTKLNFVGKQLIADNATNTSTDIQLFPNLNPDWYINQNVYPSLEWIWKHTDGYWYFVVMVLSRASGEVGSPNRKFKVYKTNDWITNTEIIAYEDTTKSFASPSIAVDSNGNIVVAVINGRTTKDLVSIFFDASNSYASTVTANISQNTSNAIETTVSLNVSADNRFGVAFFQKHSGSTSYSQLMYVERSAGSGGTWGTPEILGTTPLRATTVTSAGAIQLFYTSTNEPIIAFLNNASATSSKVAIAKKVSGTWTVYGDTITSIYNACLDSNNNVYVSPNATIRKFTYSSNAFSDSITGTNASISIDTNNDLYALCGITLGAAVAVGNIYYVKNDTNTFHKAIRHSLQIGATISTNALGTLGVVSVGAYSRQRLSSAYHLVIRTDGAIFMEVI